MNKQERMRKAIKQLALLAGKSSKMRLAAEEWVEPWKALMATIMSAQSRDEVTIVIAKKLFEKYPALKTLSGARHGDVLVVFKSLNYNRTKAANVIACAKVLVEEHGGKVPEDFDELIRLPGVGRKTANVFLSEMGHDEIGVDTHAAYISRKLGWTGQKNPEKIEMDLKALFPKRYWSRINPTLVRFGKTYTSRREKDRVLEEIKNYANGNIRP